MIPLSPVVERGKKLLDQAACRRCHLIGRQGNRLAADLDLTIHQVASRELETSILQPVSIMPDFRLTTIQAAALINALFAAGSDQKATESELPRKVHFKDRTHHKDNAFVNFCGSCHQVLTSRFGGLGEGSIGPNLSGLLTSFYPDTFGNNQAWTPENLRKWLANPRENRTFALMPPLRLKENEQKALLEIFLEPDISVEDPPVP
jgi:cytochrome c2